MPSLPRVRIECVELFDNSDNDDLAQIEFRPNRIGLIAHVNAVTGHVERTNQIVDRLSLQVDSTRYRPSARIHHKRLLVQDEIRIHLHDTVSRTADELLEQRETLPMEPKQRILRGLGRINETIGRVEGVDRRT